MHYQELIDRQADVVKALQESALRVAQHPDIAREASLALSGGIDKLATLLSHRQFASPTEEN